jgi:hypothetical protein
VSANCNIHLAKFLWFRKYKIVSVDGTAIAQHKQSRRRDYSAIRLGNRKHPQWKTVSAIRTNNQEIAQWYSARLRVGWSGVPVPTRAGSFSLHHCVQTCSGAHTQPPIQWVSGALFLRVKRLGREANHSHPSRVENKNAWSYNFTAPISLHGVVFS